MLAVVLFLSRVVALVWQPIVASLLVNEEVKHRKFNCQNNK